MIVKNQEQKSGEVYRDLVTSLFEDVQIIWIGVLSSAAAILLEAYKNDSFYLLGLAILLVVVGYVRVSWTKEFHNSIKHQELTDASARKWEKKFTLGACAQISVFGWWFFSVSILNDPVSEMISIVVITAYLVKICCRSYPFGRLLSLQLACVGVPVMAGLVVLGGYHYALGALLIPYVFGMRKIADDQRQKLLGNIFQRQEAENLAKQFDTTLNQVPHGICMYDSSGILEVANRHVVTVMGRSEESLVGSTPGDMVDMLMSEHEVSAEDGAVLLKWVNRPDSRSITHVFQMGKSTKKWIKFRSGRMESGGMIVTYEDVSKEVQAASRIDHITRFDPLTGLLNRAQFEALLEREIKSLRRGNDSGVLLINLDNFKHTNEHLGHRFGDLVLQAASDRLKQVCGETAVCARYGGDEFAVLVSSADCTDVCAMLADSIGEELMKPFELEGRSEKLGCSIGLSFKESKSDSAELLLQQASFALSSAKNIGEGEWQVYSEDMSRELQDKRELTTDLRAGIVNGELEAHFQPLVSINQQRVSVCEALVRWKHPKLGYIPPFKFIPLAEEAGIIGEIGAWMLHESCAVCATWPKGTRVAVNLSPLEFRDGDIVQRVRDTLEETGLEPSRLELEITESLMLDDMRSTISKLEELKSLGVRVSLDDFGTGYSSLSYMNKLPLDKVKIDRSFVTGLQPDSKSLTLVQAISGLGHQLGLCVVVEGIETSEEMAVLLANAEVDEIQGYYLSRPVDKHALVELLDINDNANREMVERVNPGKAIAA